MRPFLRMKIRKNGNTICFVKNCFIFTLSGIDKIVHCSELCLRLSLFIKLKHTLCLGCQNKLNDQYILFDKGAFPLVLVMMASMISNKYILVL